MEQEFAGVGSIRAGQEFDAQRLDAWLREHVDGYAGPLTVQQFNGGQSNPTYKLLTPSRHYVMRRKPPGQLLSGAHAVEREYKVITALHAAGFPVARAYALCTDEAVIGTWFYVMEMVEGRIFWDSSLPGLSKDERPVYFEVMCGTLATLHSYDPVALQLADYGKAGGYFERQIRRWSRQYQDDTAAGRDPNMDLLLEWLPANIPPGEESRIVHGDFRADNLIFHPTEPRVLAVLDWELSTLGHPLADFTYQLMMYHLPPHVIGGFNGKDLQALGIPSQSEYIAAYCRKTGRSSIEHLNFYLAFNMFRFAAILHGIKGRVVRGTASSVHADAMAGNMPLLARLAWETALSAAR